MIYLRKRSQQQSIFRFAQGFSFDSAGLMTLTFTSGTPEPGDTIFVNHRSSTGTFTSAPGWTVIDSISGLTTLARIVQPGDTGTYTYTITGGSNHSCHAMVVAGTLGYTNATLTQFSAANPCTLAPISIQKNSTVLIYFTTAGGLNSASARSLTPSDFTLALQNGFNIQSVYKQYLDADTEGFTLTWTGGVPDNTRITRIEILGNN